MPQHSHHHGHDAFGNPHDFKSYLEKLDSVGRLAAGVAHEVKNPLAVLLMGLEYLAPGLNESKPSDLAVIKAMRDAIT